MNAIIYRNNSSSAASYPPNSPTNLVATGGKQSITLTWTDPEDLQLSGGITINWKYTRIVRKASGYPENENDGIVVVENSTRTQYQSNGYVDSGFGYEETWYYAAFACSEDEVFSKEICQAVGTTKPRPKVMTVNIDFSQSDPTKMCTYADDAVGSPCGYNSEATAFWQEFFGYRPCLFKNGVVVGYLNPNKYTVFTDETTAGVANGENGDVMIEYPRRGVKMSKSGTVVTISVTDDDDADGYTYYAHSRGENKRENFYIGAYLGYVASNKLRSLSGKTNTVNTSMDSFRTYASNVGSGYTTMTYYQYLYIQIMYCFQFSNNLNSGKILGKGKYANGTYTCNSGTANVKGIVFGTPNTTGELKLFGLENPWGVSQQLIDGFYVKNNLYDNKNHSILTATDGFNNTGDGYTTQCSGVGRIEKYISDVIGTAELGFTISQTGGNGSSTTYLCDWGSLVSTCIPRVWGSGNEGESFGVFAFSCDIQNNQSSNGLTTRLAYI